MADIDVMLETCNVGKQRGLDFFAGIVVGAVIMLLASRLFTAKKRLLVAPTNPSSVAQPPVQKSPPPVTDSNKVATHSKKSKKVHLPLLPPPHFAPTLPQVLYSNAKGEVPLAWLPVDNARRYEVRITDDKGHRVELSGWVHTNISLTGLPPPALNESERVYWVEIATQNKDQMAGQYGPKRKIIYLGKALSTPKIESIHVEE